MKVLYIGRCPPHRSGVAIQHSTLVNRLAERGHVFQMLDPITPSRSKISGGYTWRFNERVQLFRHYKCSFETTASNPGTAADRMRYAAYMENLFPSLVASHEPDLVLLGGEFFAHGVARLCREAAVPSVLSAIGPFAAYFRGVLSENIGQQMLDDARQADVVIACASHMARDLRAAGLDNVELIQNNVDTDQFTDGVRDESLLRQFDIRHDDFVVLHVSNLTSPKRVLDLAAAASQTLEHSPRMLFVIVGDGPERAALEEACTRNGTSGRFRFAGWVEHPRVADFIRLSDVVAIPSETEGLALAYLETQACKRVILASDIPAAREVIANGITGLLFRMGDVGDLAGKLIFAASDSELRLQIGNRARAFVEEYHGLSDAIWKYEQVFERLIEHPRFSGWRCR